MSEQQMTKIAARVRSAFNNKTYLHIVGGNSKKTYGENTTGEVLSTKEYQGIVAYEPSELYITALSGTPLTEIEQTLRQQKQMLPFEPPHLGTTATIGGCLACGLSGPARMLNGRVRDAVLGVSMINGKGEILRFGGQMIKNVAGYDVSRLMCGALGTLGIIMEVTFRVIPIPEFETTVRLRSTATEAIHTVREYIQQNIPISASFHIDNDLYLRLSGYREHIEDILTASPLEPIPDTTDFWNNIKEQRHPFFKTGKPLWRLSLPADVPPLNLPGKQAFEWNGALRWLASSAEPADIRNALEQVNGYACLFATEQNRATTVFHPLKSALMALHRRIKYAFDPAGILNRGRLYPEL